MKKLKTELINWLCVEAVSEFQFKNHHPPSSQMSLFTRARFAVISPLRLQSAARLLHTSAARFQTKPTNNNNTSNTSLFGDVTQVNAEQAKKQQDDFSDSLQSMANAEKFDQDSVTLKNDTKLHDFIGPKPTSAVNLLLSPLKKQIYEANVAKHGFFQNNQEVTLPNGEVYKLKLSRDEIEALEPSLYIKSYRLKSSWKKATVFLRFISGMKVHEAITQAQFQRKKLGREVAEFLQDRIKDAEELNLDVSDLYIDQIWSGSDGSWSRRLDPKARGKTGIIHHPFIHVRGILKTSVTKKRLAWEKEQKELNKKPRFQLPNEKLRFRLDGHYKW